MSQEGTSVHANNFPLLTVFTIIKKKKRPNTKRKNSDHGDVWVNIFAVTANILKIDKIAYKTDILVYRKVSHELPTSKK